MANRSADRSGYLYVIQTADGLFFKIGFGLDVWKRWKAHNKGLARKYRGDLIFLGFKPATPTDDKHVRKLMGDSNRVNSPYGIGWRTQDWFMVNEHTKSVVRSLGSLQGITKPLTRRERGIDRRFLNSEPR